MLVIKKTLQNLRLLPTLRYTFARKKGKDDDKQQMKGGNTPKLQTPEQQVKIDAKQRSKSAALYDHYVKSRQRPMLTLDNYQIKFVYVIERLPIFIPYDKKRFDYYRTKYQYSKKTGYYPEIPKQLQLQTGDYLFTQYQRSNPQNVISHRNAISKTQVYQYAQNARYWKYTDPQIKDPHSIQAYSSDNVYLITKTHQGKWIFPSRLLSEKDNFKEIFTVISSQLFGGSQSPIVYLPKNKPMYARKYEDETLTRGQGFYQYFFKGISINGIPSFPNQKYADYAWVPKPLLSQYFQDNYFKETVPISVHLC